MKEENKENPKERNLLIDVLDWFIALYKHFSTLVKKNTEDNIYLIGLKYLIQGIGILILLAFSPFILLILFLAIIVVS